MNKKIKYTTALAFLLMGCTGGYEPLNFQASPMSSNTYGSMSCRELNKEIDGALIKTNQLFISLILEKKIGSPQMRETALYFQGAPKSELDEFGRLKGQLVALKAEARESNCGRYVMTPEELIEYQLNRARFAHTGVDKTVYPFQVIRFDRTDSH